MAPHHTNATDFGKNWFLHSSAGLEESGDIISSPSYHPAGWLPVDLPSTVLDGLVRNGVFPDPCVGNNLERIPGYVHVTPDADIPIHNFADMPMPKESPFRVPWWFMKEITRLKKWSDKKVWLQFGGVNYKADMWLNGRQIANQGSIQGAFQTCEIEIGSRLREDRNVLAVLVFPPGPEDLAITFSDWNPMAPDKCMGFWQPVYLRVSGNVSVRHTHVRSRLDTETLVAAELHISAEVTNHRGRPVSGTAAVALESIRLEQAVLLEAFETRTVTFEAQRFPELTIRNPRVWWPYQMGAPALYTAEVAFHCAGATLDSERVRFGIRDVQSYINSHGSRTFRVNGRDVLIRGAGWTPDLLLRQSAQKDERDILYVKNMNLNAVRVEGNMASDGFWDLADEHGVLVMSGWACCCHWERWQIWKQGDAEVARKSLSAQLLRLRNHPSFLAWLYASDLCPPIDIERAYHEECERCAPDVPVLSSATQAVSPIVGETGVKMTGPYAYVPPSYWYSDSVPGVAKGFNTEAGPGVGIPPYEGIRRMFPGDEVARDSDAWKLHTGLGAFHGTTIANRAIELRYKKPRDLREYCTIAALLSYESWRAAFEAYGRNFPEGTGFIAWMLNAAWPSLLWHLYDTYWMPTAGFYGVQKACRPLHVQYSYDDASVVVVNQKNEAVEGMRVTARVLDIEMRELFEKSSEVGVGERQAKRLFTVPTFHGEPGVHFVDLSLIQSSRVRDRNFYWLSRKPDVFADMHPFYHTPLRAHGDMSAIFDLPKAHVRSALSVRERAGTFDVSVELENDTPWLALQVDMKLLDGRTGEWILPVYWEENYVTLLPGEKRHVSGWLTTESARCESIGLSLTGPNLATDQG